MTDAGSRGEKQLEAFPPTPEEIRISRLTKMQTKFIEDLEKCDKAVENAVERQRYARIILEDCEEIIKELVDIMNTDPETGEIK